MIRKINDNEPLNLKKCEKCGAIGNFKPHASYKRYLIKTNETKRITIKRVKCLSCETTHSIISKDVVPYKQYSLSYIVEIILSWSNNCLTNIKQNNDIPSSSIRRILKSAINDASIILALLVNKENIWKNRNIFTDVNFNKSTIYKLGKKFTENIRLKNLNINDKNEKTHFT